MPSTDEAALSCWETGNEAFARSDWAAASHAYGEATRIDPAFGEAYVGLGAALGNQQKWSDCAAAHRRALDLLPGDFEAAYNLGVALSELRDFPGAEQCLRLAASVQPSSEISMRLGWALAEQSKCHEALAVFQEIMAANPDHGQAHAMAARELAHFGRIDEARAALSRVRVLEPTLFDEWEELRDLERSVGAG